MATTQSLVGREYELAVIEAFLDRAARGSGVLLVDGVAGMGKSTLWATAVERARECGFCVLVARPAEAERSLSFAVLSDLLADVHGAIARLPAPQRRPVARALLLDREGGAPLEPRAIAVGLLALLRKLAHNRPVLIAIDDDQWVDAASAMAVSFALRRTAGEPVNLVLTRRTGPEARTRIHLDTSMDVDRLEAAPLSLGALRRLLELRLGCSFPRPVFRRIHERSGGNPFFGLELARALQARGGQLHLDEELPVPYDVERLLAARLGMLPLELTEPLAAVAALAEPTLGLLGEDALQPAFDAGVLVLEGERVRFEHPLIAAAAYARLTPGRRRSLHGRLATLVEDPEERARHLALSTDGPDTAIAALLDDAAAQARSRGAPEAAAELAVLALRLTDPTDVHARVLRSVAAAEHGAVAGDHVSARALVDQALAAEPTGTDRARLLLQRTRLGDVPVDTAIAMLEEARACAAGAVRLEAAILADMTHWITNHRRVSDAEPYAQRCLELAERSGDVAVLVRALEMLATNQFWLGRGFPTQLSERALEFAPLCESMRVSERPSSIFGWMSMWTGDLDRSRALLEQARRLGEDRADITIYAVLWNAAALEYLADDWQRSLELADELYQLGIEYDHEPALISGLCARALMFAHLGDEQRTRGDVGDALALDERHGGHTATRIGGNALALLELSLDKPSAALEPARRATVEPREEGLREPGLLPWFQLHAEAAIAVGEHGEAEELLDWAEEHATRLDRAWALACCARCRGLLAAARGDEAGAVSAFARALAEHDRAPGRRFERARTLLAQGETLRRSKKKRAARDAIVEASSIFDELGATRWSAKARRELARISGRAAATGLTETERRVATLVAAGRTNKEVASELFVTVRTVETHLTHVYAKLDVSSRTELSRRLPA